ncbi:hypothetical protein D9758_009469 [Tetrapyrgos nigripes]|uniref:Autophagy-related protein 4 n=1 Tax=Tetrapyrgos nigripes TaxID=182062 RepID=A0A8H5G156_9AGAR|nr:hypothetical protein D9758_009469 [Tetrapyrgos nigripes]
MSNKHSRHTPSPSTPPPHSKLPKFLQKPSNRDRSRSVNDGAVSSPELSVTTAASSSKHTRRSKFLGGDRTVAEEPSLETEETPVIIEPPPTTPVPIPRTRTRSERPINSEPPPTSTMYASTSPSSRIGDLPTRLSGWFSHTFSTSSTDLSLPSLLSHPSQATSNSTSTGSATSPKANRLTGASALLTAAKHGKGHLDKAMRYLLDSDATPDKCMDPIWLLGVQHPGYEPSQTPPPPPSSYPAQAGTIGRRGSVTGQGSSSPSSFRPSSSDHSPGHTRSRSRGHGHSSSIGNSSQSAPNSNFLSQSQPASSRNQSSSTSSTLTAQPPLYNPNISGSSTTSLSTKDLKHPGANWPPVFYSDFTSRIWLTYRSHFPPIRDCRLGDLSPPACEPIQQPPSSPRSGHTGTSVTSTRYTDSYKSDSSSTSMSHSSRGGPSSPNSTLSNTRKWNWPGLGGEKGWTSDSGWGCRDWRRPPYPEMTKEYATYVQIVTWFLDTPSPEAPFSVHRMALAGKELGKDVGMWFGPSTAAGAINSPRSGRDPEAFFVFYLPISESITSSTLVHSYPESGLGVAVAADGGALYQTEVYAASHGSSTVYPGGKRGKGGPTSWGHRPVLLLFGIRLGIDGVNPIYYETIKLLYTFPQSVGIAGGRPSSSYYFVGSQADNLFYLDPHHARPAVPLRSPSAPAGTGSGLISEAPVKERDKEEKEKKKKVKEKKQQRSSSGSSAASGGSNHAPTSPTRSSGFHTPISPSPLQQQYSSASGTSATSGSRISTNSGGVERSGSYGSTSVSSQSPSRTDSPVSVSYNAGDMDYSELVGIEDPAQSLDPLQVHYATSYSAAELKTFHCERVRKMPLSGLDPSMLIGFLCRDENEWVDLRRRVGELPRTIFSIQDEPPKWAADSDDNIGLESMSDDDGLDMPEDDDFEVEGDDVEPSVEESGEGAEGGDDDDSEKYFDSRSRSASDSPSSTGTRSHEDSRSGKRKERGKSEEVDTEEDPVDPITPGPTATRFEIPITKSEDHEADNDKPFNEDDIEDDWVDPSVSSTPLHTPPSSQFSTSIPDVIPVKKTKSNGSTTGSIKKKKRKEKQVPVPVPKVKLPTHPVQESFPFPMAREDPPEISHSYSSSSSSGVTADHEESSSRGYEGRMHTARARDGGRTQSGGVKGILTDDWVDSDKT